MIGRLRPARFVLCSWTRCTTHVRPGVDLCQLHRWHRAKVLDELWKALA